MNKTTQYSGIVRATQRGFGFANLPDGTSIFIPPPLLKTLLSNDTITFTISQGKKADEFQVDRILHIQRPSSVILGELAFSHGFVHFLPDDPCFVPITVDTLLATPQHVVAINIPPFNGKPDSLPTSLHTTIAATLGPRSAFNFDQHYALIKENLKIHHPHNALREAYFLSNPQKLNNPPSITPINVPQALNNGYKDLRHIPLSTIDGPTTSDFDDAIFAEPNPKGPGFHAIIAIADVTAYVTPGSPLDIEAQQRTTSVYLPNLHIPMLPHALSTNLCSLIPNVPRLSLVCDAIISPDGNLTSATFYRAIITSHARLTYNQTFHFLENPTEPSDIPHPVQSSLTHLHNLYNALKTNRTGRGTIDIDDPEPILSTLPNGDLTITWELRNTAHKLVEELMLLANHAAALHISSHPTPLFRNQQTSSDEDWSKFLQWLTDHNLPHPASNALPHISAFLNDHANHPLLPLLQIQVRQTMPVATYSTEQSSHFSLGYSHYTHFTSPIRRYSDVIVHRILTNQPLSSSNLPDLAKTCSEKSRASTMAERYVWDRLKKRILVRETPNSTPMPSRVVHSSRNGIKIVFTNWQTAAFLPADTLKHHLYSFNPTSNSWSSPDGTPCEPGTILQTFWHSFTEDKSTCEITATL